MSAKDAIVELDERVSADAVMSAVGEVDERMEVELNESAATKGIKRTAVRPRIVSFDIRSTSRSKTARGE
ncbi:hypothetical protein HK101_011633 [Irineochytrium annulatum]|nr:hypothetical protein HK101_011633 [Irineochytrium annulatum]